MGVSTKLLIARRKREAEEREAATPKVSTKKKVEPAKDSEDE